VPVPPSYPVLGDDAFRTGTGVHAAAIIKARRKGHAWLADRIYSGVPAGDFGLAQRIEISPVSGLSNVRYWLDENGFDSADQELCQHIFDAAKRLSRVLRDDELHEMVREFQRTPADA
jgi:2-isopropylmalate synthase